MRPLARTLLIAGLVWLTPVTAGLAQTADPGLTRACERAGLGLDELARCRDVVAAMQLLQPELGMALAGGNPVLGTASPIGTKFRFIPRIYLGGRINLVWAAIPDVRSYPEDLQAPLGTREFSVPMPQLDVSVGLFEGVRVGSIWGGLGSVELLGSLGPMILPAGEGFENDATGVGLGARIGIMRESFTAPGLSLSGEYQWAGRIRHGSVARGDDAEFGMDVSATSLRIGLSKSFVAIGLALTLGWDHYQSDVDLALADADGSLVTIVPAGESLSLSEDRWSAAVDVSYIVLFLNIAAEFGWQEAGRYTTSRGDEITSGNFFSAIGIRVSL
jgi:hypothetical protein